MSDAIQFLHVLAQTLSAHTLYVRGHPATRRSLEQLWRAAAGLLVADPHPVFLFLGTAPVYAGRALHELDDWQHSARLAAVGVQRLEFNSALTLESLGQLVDVLTAKLASGAPGGDDVASIPGVAFGVVAVPERAALSDADTTRPPAGTESMLQLDLVDELEAMQFIRSEAARGVVARAEADAVVRILAALGEGRRVAQAAQPGDARGYHAVHPVNTALLAMSAAGAAGLDGAGRHRIGVVALLHDIGMALLPAALADQEEHAGAQRRQVEAHTVAGAELLLRQGGAGCELAAVVAFEHHLRPDGNGYPLRRFTPAPHWASRLIGCCAVFAALCTRRSFRAKWPVERAVRHLEAGSGAAFDPEIAALVVSVVRSV